MNNKFSAVAVSYKANNKYQNELIIRKCWFIHNKAVAVLLYIKVRGKEETSNNVVQIINCVFSYNDGTQQNSFLTVIKIYGLITKLFISYCDFCNNKNLSVIRQAAGMGGFLACKMGLFVDIFISNTNFSLTHYNSVVYLMTASLYLIGPIIFHNNLCNNSTSVIYNDKGKVFLQIILSFQLIKDIQLLHIIAGIIL